MNLRDIEYGQVVRMTRAGSPIHGALLLGVETGDNYEVRWGHKEDRTDHSRVIAVILVPPPRDAFYKRGYVVTEAQGFPNEQCELVNFQFDGVTEPAPQPVAPPWATSTHIARVVAERMARPHWQADIADIKRAYFYEGATVQYRDREGSTLGNGRNWITAHNFTFNTERDHVLTNLGWTQHCEYRIKPEGEA